MANEKKNTETRMKPEVEAWVLPLVAIIKAKTDIRYPTGAKLRSIFNDYLEAVRFSLHCSLKKIKVIDGDPGDYNLETAANDSNGFYAIVVNDLWGIGYKFSYANPAYVISQFGEELGPILCFIFSLFRNGPLYFIQKRYKDLCRLNDLYHKVYELACTYDLFATDFSAWHRLVREFMHEGIESAQQYNLHWRFSPENKYYKKIVMESDLKDPMYLYKYGIYVSRHIMDLAFFMQKYPENELKKLSEYIVQSYKDGFERTQRTHKGKKYCILIIPAGMERLGRMVVQDLETIGLEAVVTQPVAQSIHKQYDYDHRFQMSLYYVEEYVSKMLAAYEKNAEKLKKVLGSHAGPVYIELFGEEPFVPEETPGKFKLTPGQQKLMQQTNNKTSQTFYRFYKQEQTGFCIIAFPSPEIGDDFKKIFKDTVRLNTLDSMKYAAIQQKIIDLLDTADTVHVKGKGKNRTDISVKLHKIKDPAKETNFENCVADVNIPVGEVFTSPVLKGTSGTLHVKDAYLRNLRFKNLVLTFKDGYITDYSCTNYKEVAANCNYV